VFTASIFVRVSCNANLPPISMGVKAVCNRAVARLKLFGAALLDIASHHECADSLLEVESSTCASAMGWLCHAVVHSGVGPGAFSLGTCFNTHPLRGLLGAAATQLN